MNGGKYLETKLNCIKRPEKQHIHSYQKVKRNVFCKRNRKFRFSYTLSNNISIYVHTYIHTNIHTYNHTYIDTYIHTYVWYR